MSAKCKHRWKFRVSQDGLLYVRFCPKCCICEYLDENRGLSTMRYAEKIPTFQEMLDSASRDAAKLPAWKRAFIAQVDRT